MKATPEHQSGSCWSLRKIPHEKFQKQNSESDKKMSDQTILSDKKIVWSDNF